MERFQKEKMKKKDKKKLKEKLNRFFDLLTAPSTLSFICIIVFVIYISILRGSSASAMLSGVFLFSLFLIPVTIHFLIMSIENLTEVIKNKK